jgi:hypothetical protein
MNCPNCGTPNSDTSRFCLKCGFKLSDPEITNTKTPVDSSMTPKNPFTQLALVGGIPSMVGGGMVILGWLTPWFSFGGLAELLMDILGMGGSGRLNLGRGLGNGAQITLSFLVGGLAGFASNEGAGIVLGLILWVIAALIISIPIMAFYNTKNGFKIFEARILAKSQGQKLDLKLIKNILLKIKKRSSTIFIIMAVIFIILSIFPFGTSTLSGGFYFTLLGSAVSFFGSYFTQYILRDLDE